MKIYQWKNKWRLSRPFLFILLIFLCFCMQHTAHAQANNSDPNLTTAPTTVPPLPTTTPDTDLSPPIEPTSTTPADPNETRVPGSPTTTTPVTTLPTTTTSLPLPTTTTVKPPTTTKVTTVTPTTTTASPRPTTTPVSDVDITTTAAPPPVFIEEGTSSPSNSQSLDGSDTSSNTGSAGTTSSSSMQDQTVLLVVISIVGISCILALCSLCCLQRRSYALNEYDLPSPSDSFPRRSVKDMKISENLSTRFTENSSENPSIHENHYVRARNITNNNMPAEYIHGSRPSLVDGIRPTRAGTFMSNVSVGHRLTGASNGSFVSRSVPTNNIEIDIDNDHYYEPQNGNARTSYSSYQSSSEYSGMDRLSSYNSLHDDSRSTTISMGTDNWFKSIPSPKEGDRYTLANGEPKQNERGSFEI